MNKYLTYIRCLDEGHGPVTEVPSESAGSSALMVNPAAALSVLLDAANARTSRIVDVAKPFLELETLSSDLTLDDACRVLTTAAAMAHEVCCLLAAAQARHYGDVTAAHKAKDADHE